jgi:serine/threonine protein kinase
VTQAGRLDIEDREGRLDEAVAEYLQAAEAGAEPDRPQWLARHPDLAPELERFLAGRAQLERVAAPLRAVAEPGAAPPGQTLGDFRIVREVGRGGMGVVYEAEQLPLNRRVALKVLPFAATMDPRHLQRFHNEAKAAACLHHEHIVPVHAVGSERGVHFYAMQFIDGQSLAAFLAQQSDDPARADQPTTPYSRSPAPADPAVETAARAAKSTARAPRDGACFRRVAEWGVQAAEALDCAHQMGIVHRDVKPANLLIDATGRLWVTDFGLAQVQSDARLTMTGDLLGTLRYMSPEQALAKRVVVDHRTDVYSLGATLYELLTLRPPFAGEDRQELLRHIAFEEPAPPRRLDRAVPAELETIVLKALEKNPVDRYATAKELADDLRRYLEDRPIRARRPSLAQVAVKWARRHRGLVAGLTLTLMLTLLTLGVANFLIWRANRDEREALRRMYLYQKEVTLHAGTYSSELNAALKEHADARFAALRRVDRVADTVLAQLPKATTEPPPAQQDLLGYVAELYEPLLAGVVPPPTVSQPALPGEPPDPLPDGLLARRIFWGETLDGSSGGGRLLLRRIFWSLVRLGIVHARSGEFAQATEAFRVAEATAGWIARVNGSLSTPGNWPFELGEPARVRAAYREALKYWGRRSPASLGRIYDYRLGVAHLLSPEGLEHASVKSMQRMPEKVAWRNLDLVEQVFVDLPTEAHWSIFAGVGAAWGTCLGRAGRSAQANRVYLRALQLFVEKAVDAPNARLSASAGYPLLAFRGQRGSAAEQAFRQVWARYARKITVGSADAAALIHLARLIQTDQRFQSEAREVALKAWALLPGPYPPGKEPLHPHPDEPLFRLGEVLLKTGCLKEAEGAFREALVLSRRLLKEDPGNSWRLTRLADTLHRLGVVLLRAGRPKEARASFREALGLCREHLRRDPDNLWVLDTLTWRLAVHPDPALRNPNEAVALARRLDALVRSRGEAGGAGPRSRQSGQAAPLPPSLAQSYWNTVGVARCRAGDWKGAREAFGRTDRREEGVLVFDHLGNGRNAREAVGQTDRREAQPNLIVLVSRVALANAGGEFFRALAHWQLGQEKAALEEYAEAVRWMERYAPEDDDLKRFRAEATTLMGIRNAPAATAVGPSGKPGVR